VNPSAASFWQNRAYKRINHKIKLLNEEFKEILVLKMRAEAFRDLRKKLLTEKCD